MHRYLMFFIKPKKLIFIFLIIISAFYLYLGVSDNCKTLNVFKSTYDFGFSHLNKCYSTTEVTPKIKELLKDSPILYAVAREVKNKRNNLKLDNAPRSENIDYVKKQKGLSKKLEEPFIKGILNAQFKNNNAPKDYYINENWSRSHGDHSNSKFSPGKQITKENIQNLKLVWKYSSIEKDDLEKKWKRNVESNPIYLNGKIISTTPDRKVIANDAKTGKLIWELQSLLEPGRRGMVSYEDKNKNIFYLLVHLSGKVYKINSENGKIEKNFGNKGYVDAFTLVAPLLYQNKLIVVGTNNLSVFELDSGKRLGKYTLRDKDRNFYRGAIWGGTALDRNKGIVFATTGNPQPGIYGVNRPGDNKNSSSVIAFDINKEKIIWTFQETRHDLWDFDLASPPILHNLKINDEVFEVVIALSKTGNTLILERNTGKPIFDINFKKAPISNLPGEFASPYQIYLKKPERFSEIEYSLKSFDKLSDNKIKEINNKLKNAKFGWFETPSFEKDLISFGLHGGAQWMGASLDPFNQFLYIPVNNVPWKLKPYLQSSEIKTFFTKELKDNHKIYLNKCASCHGKNRNGKYGKFKEKENKNLVPNLVGFYSVPGMKDKLNSLEELNQKHENMNIDQSDLNKIKTLFKEWDKKIYENNEIIVKGNGQAWSQFLTSDDLPASNPPWGYIAKLDLESGKVIWKAPHGDIVQDGKTIKVGTVNYGGTALNGSDILFFTGTDDSKAYAIDGKTGEEIWSFEMEAAGSAAPTIYEYKGKQYVTFISTGGIYHNYKSKSSTLYTFSLN